MSGHPAKFPYYCEGDALTEAEYAAKLKPPRTVRFLRKQRKKGEGPSYSRNGKSITYSWMKHLEYVAANEVHPVRARRRA